MNTQLVDSLVQGILSLSEEERALLESKLEPVLLELKLKRQKKSQEAFQQLIELGDKINARRGGKPLDPPPEEIIQQMREERTEQLMRSGFPQFYPDES